MKLYPFLILSLFALVSCEPDKKVYMIDRKDTQKGILKHAGFEGEEYNLELDIEIVFWIPDDEDNSIYKDCVVINFTYNSFDCPDTSKEVKNEVLSMWRYRTYEVKFYDKNKQEIFSFTSDYLTTTGKDPTWVVRDFPSRHAPRKLWENYNTNNIVSPEKFRSKIRKMKFYTIKVGWIADSKDLDSIILR